MIVVSNQCVSKCFLLLCQNWSEYAEKTWPDTDEGRKSARAYLEMVTMCFADIPDEVLEMATLHCISTLTFWPKIAELRAATTDILINQLGLPTSGEAWAEVRRALKAYNPNPQTRPRTPFPWSSPLVEQALDAAGGMAAFAMSDVIQIPVWQAHFTKAYEDLVRKTRANVQALPQVREAMRLAVGEETKKLESRS